jgi:flavin reductase (DIM6/NTAB) family NADH-FMN oxidoreductase RutF
MKKIYTPHDRSVPQSPDEPFETPGFLPVSVAMVGVADPDGGPPNILPLVAWTFLNRHPMYLGIGVCTKEYNNDYYERGSYEMLRRTMDFSLNFPTDRLREEISETGRLSRHKDPTVDKFKETGLTPLPGNRIQSPHISECPVNFECIVRSIVHLGSHDLFVGEVVGVFMDGTIEGQQAREGDDSIRLRRDDGSILTLNWSTLIVEEVTEGENQNEEND